ncbi:unnamed protein product [Candida verbasci]|uniref:Alpha-1,2-mannosyltransferase n=1 Tax=Candida verbasci TaxID=1227364 RepID=A0A9W4TUC7_9ASCO|nr:unnamed protein product [Candida verbasci]
MLHQILNKLHLPNIPNKITRIIIIGLFTFTIFNIIYFFHRSSSSSLLSSSSKLILNKLSYFKQFKDYSSKLKDDEQYSLIGYHHDSNTDLVVVQKYYYSKNIHNDPAEHFWNFLDSNFDTKSNYDLKLIDGYNYNKLLNSIFEENALQLNHSFVDKYKMEMHFIQSFQEFFKTLFDLIEDSKPVLGGINDDSHYPNSQKLEDYYKKLNDLSDEQMKKVRIDSVVHKKGRIPVYGGHFRENYLDEPIRSKELLNMYLTLNKFEIDTLKQSHDKFLSGMMNEWPEDLFKFNKFNNFMKGDGIVYLAGEKYNQLAFLSIKVLRDNGSKLPVEVIIPKQEDYDVQFCDRILPTLNARCKIMADYLPHGIMDKITGFQYKNIAILISDFERILYLDADNIPIKNPDVLFSNKPFTNKHLILWPDFWRRSTSPHYYDIAGIPIDVNHKMRNSYVKGDKRGQKTDTKDYSLHDCKNSIPEASSETGQLLINKKVHFKTLILTMYYNYFGPNFYYPLFSQGAAGEGDKETFIAAAHKLNLPYYQVNEFNREFGPINDHSKKHDIYAMGQYDPIIDYIQLNEDPDLKTNKNYPSDLPPKYAHHDGDDSYSNYDFHSFKSSSLFFLHANWPKYYLERLFLHNYGDDRGTVTNSGNKRRLYGNELKNELGGYDFELNLMNHLHWCFCDEPLINIKHVPDINDPKRKEICNKIDDHRNYLQNK